MFNNMRTKIILTYFEFNTCVTTQCVVILWNANKTYSKKDQQMNEDAIEQYRYELMRLIGDLENVRDFACEYNIGFNGSIIDILRSQFYEVLDLLEKSDFKEVRNFAVKNLIDAANYIFNDLGLESRYRDYIKRSEKEHPTASYAHDDAFCLREGRGMHNNPVHYYLLKAWVASQQSDK